MDTAALGKFLLTLLVANGIGFVVAAVISPPDPFTQLVYYLPVIPITVVVAYVLVYKGGFDRIEAAI